MPSLHRRLTSAITALALLTLLLTAAAAQPALAAEPNRQPWQHVAGSCAPSVQGATFAIVGTGCGGTGTGFDTKSVFSPTIIRDAASAALPCEAGRTSGTCFRMWYIGVDDQLSGGADFRRVGYALSPDGRSWTRRVGPGTGGSVFEGSAEAGAFDERGISTMSVVHDTASAATPCENGRTSGVCYRMWYTGIGPNDYLEGIGYAVSPNGISWTRVPGAAGSAATTNNHAVLVERGGVNDFDRFAVLSPSVLIDQATAALPCESGRTSGRCFRMWFQGGDTDTGAFSVGYAVSPNGISWTLVIGADNGGSVFSRTAPERWQEFDGNAINVISVIKDGALYRMWYEAKSYAIPDEFATGYVVSANGIAWERPDPNLPVFTGADDPGTPPAGDTDSISSIRALKTGASYELRYAYGILPRTQRIGLARMTPGTPLAAFALQRAGNSYTVTFTTASAIPAGGSVLLTLPAEIPFAQVVPGTIDGFGAATLTADPAAITDAASGGVARGALLIRLPSGAAAGPKTVRFSLGAGALNAVLVQTFDTREVLEYSQTTVAELMITNTDGSDTQTMGSPVTYTVTVTNQGPSNVAAATVTNTLPAALTGVTWTCAASAGSSCPASGAGPLNTAVSLLANGTATFTIRGTLSPAARGSIEHTAAVSALSILESSTADNTATDTSAIRSFMYLPTVGR